MQKTLDSRTLAPQPGELNQASNCTLTSSKIPVFTEKMNCRNIRRTTPRANVSSRTSSKNDPNDMTAVAKKTKSKMTTTKQLKKQKEDKERADILVEITDQLGADHNLNDKQLTIEINRRLRIRSLENRNEEETCNASEIVPPDFFRERSNSEFESTTLNLESDLGKNTILPQVGYSDNYMEFTETSSIADTLMSVNPDICQNSADLNTPITELEHKRSITRQDKLTETQKIQSNNEKEKNIQERVMGFS